MKSHSNAVPGCCLLDLWPGTEFSLFSAGIAPDLSYLPHSCGPGQPESAEELYGGIFKLQVQQRVDATDTMQSWTGSRSRLGKSRLPPSQNEVKNLGLLFENLLRAVRFLCQGQFRRVWNEVHVRRYRFVYEIIWFFARPLRSSARPEPSGNLTLQTKHPVAFESPDHLAPK